MHHGGLLSPAPAVLSGLIEPPGPRAPSGVTEPPSLPSPCSWVPPCPWSGSGGDQSVDRVEVPPATGVSGRLLPPPCSQRQRLGVGSPSPGDSPGLLAWVRGCGGTKGPPVKVGWGCCKELGCPSPPPRARLLTRPPCPLPRDLRGLQSGGSSLHGCRPHVPPVEGAVRHLGHAVRQRNPGEDPSLPGWGGGGLRTEQGPQSLLPLQVLSNLVMEELLPELRTTIGPRLKGKAQERQRTWIQVWGWGCRGGGHRPLPSPCLHCLCFGGHAATSLPCRARCPPAFLPL